MGPIRANKTCFGAVGPFRVILDVFFLSQKWRILQKVKFGKIYFANADLHELSWT